jgi:hypothetical protein
MQTTDEHHIFKHTQCRFFIWIENGHDAIDFPTTIKKQPLIAVKKEHFMFVGSTVKKTGGIIN